jgi:hypothetical protein
MEMHETGQRSHSAHDLPGMVSLRVLQLSLGADRLPAGEQVGAQPAAVHEAPQHPGPGQALEMGARFAAPPATPNPKT